FTAKGDAKLAGILARFDAAVGTIGGGPTNLKLLINMAGGAPLLQFDGTPHQAAETLKGKLDAQIAPPRGPPPTVGGRRPRRPPPALTKPFMLSSSIDASAKAVMLPDIAVALGDDKATGNIAVQLGAPIQADVALAFGSLDLDKLMVEAQAPVEGAAASGTTS